MKQMGPFKKSAALLLALCLLLGMAPAAAAAGSGPDERDPIGSAADRYGSPSEPEIAGPGVAVAGFPDPNEVVRVSIVLEQLAPMAIGYSAAEVTNTGRARTYRTKIRESQIDLQKLIESKVLEGGSLDVVWNLTYAANIISANVVRSDIDAIRQLPGVKAVEEEMRYTVGDELPAEPNMALSGGLTGSQTVWTSGYTGAGTKIAIIDTGLDWKHQSFDPDAFLYSLRETEKVTGKEYDLLDRTDVANLLPELNINGLEGAEAAKIYLNAKVPFAYNYIDENNTVDHLSDDASEHGSHVAGIAAANRYIDMDENREDEVHDYKNALDTVYVAGNAPDAQLVIMKVFGAGGGAYESDYVAAIEDALLLQCDAVNLSLGSAQAGLAKPETYQEIFDKLAEQSKTVVSISSGNTGNWPEETSTGKLYSDGVNFATDGSPGSFTNAFTVASVDNNGFIDRTMVVGDHHFAFTAPGNADQLPDFYTLDKSGADEGTKVRFVMLDESTAGHEAEYLPVLKEKETLSDAVVILWRGTTNFTVKVKAAFDAGARGVLVANNASGTISMDLTDLDEAVNIPAATVTQADGQYIWNYIEDKETAEGTLAPAEGEDAEAYSFEYITGELTVINKVKIYPGEGTDRPVMSYFSSWGVPGTLELKPEITAPGGNIYSVYGEIEGSDDGTEDHDDYEQMSGTSMAAPQVAGLAAQVQQYLNEEHPDYRTHSRRVLTQSLLMSTARALKDGDNYYPVIQQGAGLADVRAAVSTPVYIIVDGQNDGKVKVELGDDALKKGAYTFGFTLYNLTEDPCTYGLDADMFTQAVVEEDGTKYLTTGTRTLDMTALFSTGNSVTVPGGGKAEVKVTVSFNEGELETLEEDNPCGAYIEGFVTATPQTTEDGGVPPTLSIPVLGFYGNWSDSPMFDLGDCDNWIDQDFAELNGRIPYMYKDGVMLGYATNAVKANGALLKNNDGISGLSSVDYFYYTLIRNAGGMRVVITDRKTDEVLLEKNYVSDYAAYYSGSEWSHEQSYVYIGWTPPADLPEDAELEVTLIAAPEYYADENGRYDWEKLTNGELGEDDPELGQGCYLRTTLTVDNEEPVIVSAKPVEAEDGTRTIEVTARDNVGVSRIALYSGDGKTLVYEFSGDYYREDADGNVETTFDRTEPGKEGKVVFDGIYSLNFMLQIFGLNIWEEGKALKDDVYKVVVEDIAGHEVSERIFLGMDPTDQVTKVSITPSPLRMIPMRTAALTAEVLPVNAKDRTVTWASEDDSVATVDQNGNVTALAVGETTITATSTLGQVVGKCPVYVQPVYVTVNGVMVGADDTANKFSWDIAASELETGAEVYGTPVGGAAVEGTGQMYLYDAGGNLYLVDASGKKIDDVASWSDEEIIPSAIDYSETGSFKGLWAAKNGDLYYYADPTNLNDYVVKLEKDLIKSTRKPPIIGIAVANQDWKYSSYKGDTVVYAVTAGGYVCAIGCFAQNDTLKCVLMKAVSTDLSGYVQLQGKDDFPLCDLVWTDNRLYLSARSGDGCTFLRLPTAMTSADSSNATLSSKWDYMGKLDSAALDHAIMGEVDRIRYDFNGDAKFDLADAQLLLDSIVAWEDLIDNLTDQNVDGEGLKGYADTHDVHALLKILNNVDEDFENGSLTWPGSERDADSGVTVPEIRYEGNKIYVPVYANNSTNGEFILMWDHMSSRDQNHLLTLEDVIVEKGDYVTSIFYAEEYFGEPDIYFGYAGAEPLNGLLLTMVLSYEPRDAEAMAYMEFRLSQEGLDGETYDESLDVPLPVAPVITGESQVEAAEGAFGEGVTEEDQNAVLEALASSKPDQTSMLNAMDVIVDGDDLAAAKEAIKSAGISDDAVRIVSEAYLDVTVNGYEKDENGATLTLNIDACCHLLATTAAKNSDIVKEPGEGEEQNTVLLDGTEHRIPVNEPILMEIGLPAGFAEAGTKIYVKHTKNGDHYHLATISAPENGDYLIAAFTSTDGLSPFVFTSKAVEPGARIGDTYYETLQQAVDAAKDGDTVTVLKSGEKASVGRELTVTLEGGGVELAEDTLTPAGGYEMSVEDNTYTFTRVYTAPAAYSVTVSQTRHGAVTADRKTASRGATVTLTPSPEEGYAVDSVTVTDRNGNAVEVTDNGDGTYSFKMPSGAVTVKVTFALSCQRGDACPMASFRDVDLSAWYHDGVHYCLKNGLMIGVGDGVFDPAGKTTRGTIMTMLARRAGVDTAGSDPWYKAGVDWAASENISDGTAQERSITRAEIITMLYRTVNGPEAKASVLDRFPDAGTVPDWAADAMAWAVESGIIEGNGEGMLNPMGDASRVEVAKIMMVFCELTAE